MTVQLDLSHIKQVVEVCLLTANDTISLQQISSVFDDEINTSLLEKVIFELNQDYANKSLELLSLSTGYRFRSRLEFQPYLNKLNQVKPAKYSRAIMETLAIIAYRQPVTRGDIEDIRGVSINSNILQTLFERNWIEVVGHKQVPGKPELLATTPTFLNELGIASLQELPILQQIDTTSINLHNDFIDEYDKQKELNNGE